MKKITKNDLADAIFDKTDFERQTILEVIDAFMGELKADLADGSVIELRGFGTFEPRLRKGREEARNPKTGEKCSVEPHYVAVFRPGQELKKSMMELKVLE